MNCLNLRQNDIVLHRAGVRLNYFVVESCTRRGVYVLSPISWNGQSFIRDGMLEGDNCEYTISELLADEQAGEEWEMVGVGVEN